jgi:hypothetical protein
MGLEHKNCIFADIFDEIAALRKSIIHNGWKAYRRIPQKSSKSWFEEGDEIFMDRFKFENFIIDEVYAFIKEFRIDQYKFIRSFKKKVLLKLSFKLSCDKFISQQINQHCGAGVGFDVV